MNSSVPRALFTVCITPLVHVCVDICQSLLNVEDFSVTLSEGYIEIPLGGDK